MKYQFTHMVKLLNCVSSEKEARTPGTDTPTVSILGVRPQQVTHWAIMRDFLLPIDCPDLVQPVNMWGQPSMHAKYLTPKKE